MKRHRITAFYMETLFLIAVLIAVILVLTRVFGMGRSKSQDARLLTSAVSLAQNAAEAVSGASSAEEAAALLWPEAVIETDDTQQIRIRYNRAMEPDPEGELLLVASWEPEETISGTLVTSHISVLLDQEAEPVYALETAVFLR